MDASCGILCRTWKMRTNWRSSDCMSAAERADTLQCMSHGPASGPSRSMDVCSRVRTWDTDIFFWSVVTFFSVWDEYRLVTSKLQDRTDPSHVDRNVGNVDFQADFIDKNPKFRSLKRRSGTDGFVFKTDPLYEVLIPWNRLGFKADWRRGSSGLVSVRYTGSSWSIWPKWLVLSRDEPGPGQTEPKFWSRLETDRLFLESWPRTRRLLC